VYKGLFLLWGQTHEIPDGLGDASVYRKARIQGAHAVLKHHLDIRTKGTVAFPGGRHHAFAVEQDRPRTGRNNAGQDPGERRLAGAGLADQDGQLARTMDKAASETACVFPLPVL
jgi:hypothetical protein